MDDCDRVHLYKWVVILLNIIISIVGIAMICIGFQLRMRSETWGFFEIDDSVATRFAIGVTVLIALGMVLQVLAIVGHYGVCRGSRVALTVNVYLLGVLTCVTVFIGAVAYITWEEMGKRLSEFYITVYHQYRMKKDPSLFFDLKLFHDALNCCGIGKSLEPSIQYSCPTKYFIDLNMPSCLKAIETLFPSKASLILGCFVGTGVVLVITFIFSWLLSRDITGSFSSSVNALSRRSAVLTVPYGSLNVGVHPVTLHRPCPLPQSRLRSYTEDCEANERT